MAIGIIRLAFKYCSVKIQSCIRLHRSPNDASAFCNLFCDGSSCISVLIISYRMMERYIAKQIQYKFRKIICNRTNRGISFQLFLLRSRYIIVRNGAMATTTIRPMATQR